MDFTQIDHAISAFKEGKLVAIPTETVYGLSAPYNDLKLVKRIFELKSRPLFDPLIVHVSDIEQAKTLTKSWSHGAQKLAEKFWPGPLTMVLEKSNLVDDLISSGLSTVGIRCPNNSLSLEFIKKLNTPLVAPSANHFKKTSPSMAKHVTDVFSEQDVFCIDGGVCEVGIESTIVRVFNDEQLEILRPGILSKSDFSKLGFEVVKNKLDKIEAPGQMQDHYMPEKPLVLNWGLDSQLTEIRLREFGIEDVEVLEISNDPFLAARSLYQTLRTHTEASALMIYLSENLKLDEKWTGILDRLKKASRFEITA
ncbi:MAG: threonylcarbamoyl-AMP synthase [Bdellovibrionaceae bacterium]|nr:threonylcarbamoyl-AMP synthase [Pseudobdellovibrionaceae bacterium]|tara:strand:- start:68312 stop:69241 length:930 start_codon:yes stop_codon:yes gene_type:complete